MPKLNEVFGGDYLKAEDLAGKAVPVVISSVEVKQFDDGKKLIIAFEGKEKTLVCNKTNAEILKENFQSSDTDEWIGKRAVLVTEKVNFQGKLTPAIRFKLEQRQQEELPADSTVPF